jgi:uncharacterized phage protein gp47/JayE
VTTLAELITTQTPEQAAAAITTRLAGGDDPFPVTAWQPGSVPRTLIGAVANGFSDFSVMAAAVAAGGVLDLATGAWLTLHAASRFRVRRRLAAFARGAVRVTCAAGAGPHVVSAGGLIVTDGSRRWRSTNTTSVSVASGTTVEIPVRAEEAGTAYNAASGAITRIVTPAGAGLSVTNASDWLASPGTAEESDAALRQRCRDRWATRGRGASLAAYRYLASTDADGVPYASVTRVAVILGPGNGTLRIVLAGAPTVAAADLAAITASVLSRSPFTDAPTVAAATVVAVAVAGTVYVRPASDSTANRAVATTAVNNLFQALPIGSTVDREAIAGAIYSAAGITDVDLTAPATDLTLANDAVATPTVTLTWVVA